MTRQSTYLQIQVLLIHHDAPLVVRLRSLRNAFDLVHDHAVLVDRWTQQQVRGFLFDEEVSVGGGLIETKGRPDSEDGLPRVGASYVHVELVCELHSVLILAVLWVKEEVAVGLLAQFREGRHVLKATLTVRKEK